MRKALTLISLSAALYAAPAAAQFEGDSVEQAAAVFCESHGDLDIGARAPYLSPALLEAIAAADAVSQLYVDAYPDEKPPLGDGIPWQAWPDYADACTPGDPLYDGDEATVAITYTFIEYPDATYSDELRFVRVDGDWLIDDVIYAENTLTLRSILDNIAATPPE
ncbi:hypothetical protein [Pelagibacterium limicola]|uniref:hypothetical protein n=1 Tax=Pelagibacterium limicola TaxID=2791022 RepID=UPI0018AFDA06|nr:hypothetical protein [Pelagibacterium limicola]